MIELPIWLFVLILIFAAGMGGYLLVTVFGNLNSDSCEEEITRTKITKLELDLTQERSKTRDAMDELTTWRIRYRDLVDQKADGDDRLSALQVMYNELEERYRRLSDTYDTLKLAVEFQPTRKTCLGCCTQPVRSVEEILHEEEEGEPTESTEVVQAEWGRPIYINNAGFYTIPCSHYHYSSTVRSKEFRPMFCSNCGAMMTNATKPD